MLDDLHWSDEASIELLAALLRRGARRSGAARARASAPDRRRRGSSAALAVPSARRIALEPLTEAQATELLGELDPRAAAAIYRHGGGNPFYLEQLKRAREDGRLPAAIDSDGADVDVAGVPVPAAVAASLAEELASLPADELRAAPRGRGRGRAVRARSGGGDRRASRAGRAQRARRAARARPRAPDAGAAPVRLPAPARAAGGLRGGAGRLAARGPRTGRRRARRSRARPRPSVRTTSSSTRARATRRRSRSCSRPGRRGGAALRPRRPAGSRRPCACCPRPTSARWTCASPSPRRSARSASSIAAARRCSRRSSCFRRTPSRGRVELTAQCAAVEHWLGRHDEAHRRLTRAWEELPDRSTAEAAVLEIELAVDGLYERDFEQAVEMGRQALATARAVGDRALVAVGRGGALPRRDGRGAHRRRPRAPAGGARPSSTGSRTRSSRRASRRSTTSPGPRPTWSATTTRSPTSSGASRSRRAFGEGQLLVPLTLAKNFPFEMQGRLSEARELLRDGARGRAAVGEPARALPRPLRARLDAVLRRRPRRRDRGPRGELARRPAAGRSARSRTAAAGRAGGSASPGSRRARSSAAGSCCSSSSARTARARCPSSAASTGRA